MTLVLYRVMGLFSNIKSTVQPPEEYVSSYRGDFDNSHPKQTAALRDGTLRDLNRLTIPNADGPDQPLEDNKTHDPKAEVEVIFRNLAPELIRRIEKADAVVGCVAWLTDLKILAALAKVPSGAQLIVQKEDFLRPDKASKAELRRAYYAVSAPDVGWLTLGKAGANGGGYLSYLCEMPGEGDGVRCVGNVNSAKRPAHPRMHNKFLVFCRRDVRIERVPARPSTGTGFWRQGYDAYDHEIITYKPLAVWTGSFNLTYNGGQSLENAVVIESEGVAGAYFKEWQQIFALSEPLNWEEPWIAPQFRIGT